MILTWNVRGAAKRHFIKTIWDIVSMFNVHVLVIMEPHISGWKALTVVSKLGFTDYFILDADGFSGGIWLLWKVDTVQLRVVACSHSVTALVTMTNVSWMFTAVCASPNQGTHRILWPYLIVHLTLVKCRGYLWGTLMRWFLVGT